MTLDELIAKLQLIRKNDPDAGKLDVVITGAYNSTTVFSINKEVFRECDDEEHIFIGTDLH